MRHRFEPGRLVLGLGLLVIAAAYLARTAGSAAWPLPLLCVLLPVTLGAAAAVAIATQVVRRRRGD